MNLKETLLFIYGVIFATSTPYLKPKKRFLFPTSTWKFDADKFGSSLTFFLGGSGACAQLRSDSEAMFVNTNIDEAAAQWRADSALLGATSQASLVLSNLSGAYGDLQTVQAMGSFAKVYVHGESSQELEALARLPIENVARETVMTIGDETVRLIPVEGCATGSDLVVFFEKRSVMMFGALFANRIHPLLKIGVSARVGRWVATLEDLMARFSPSVCVPGEGDVGRMEDVREFIRYLKSLTDDSVEFSFCRANFDWMEIPRSTSLEENFDILRRNVKTHTSIR